MNKQIISKCPICSGGMEIGRLACGDCDTVIDSRLPIPPFFRLPADLQRFVMVFLRCRGNIREAEKELGISYPTVCKRLDQVNELLGNRSASPRPDGPEILSRLESGEITADEAVRLLKGEMA
jgi:hypothetical protein